MNKEQYEAVKFGFILILIWLTLLTGCQIYDKIFVGGRLIILPPPAVQLEPLEVEMGGLYD